MPLTPSIAVAQSGLSPNLVVITDDSSGADAAVTSRRVFVQDTSGEYYVPEGTTTDYTQWSYADASISLNILTQDIGALITVQWLDVSNTVLYTYTNTYPLAEYNKQFFYYLFQQQSLAPSVVQDANYYANLSTFWADVQGGVNCVTLADDIAACQNAFNRATNMRLNEAIYF